MSSSNFVSIDRELGGIIDKIFAKYYAHATRCKDCQYALNIVKPALKAAVEEHFSDPYEYSEGQKILNNLLGSEILKECKEAKV